MIQDSHGTEQRRQLTHLALLVSRAQYKQELGIPYEDVLKEIEEAARAARAE